MNAKVTNAPSHKRGAEDARLLRWYSAAFPSLYSSDTMMARNPFVER
jgi:hypothetical protein